MSGTGLIHLYCGDGKGKTTAAVGLAVRHAGAGGKVVLAQFLKDGTSGECRALAGLKNVTMLAANPCGKFSFQMSGEEKQECRAAVGRTFAAATSFAVREGATLLVLDEVCAAVNRGFLDEDALLAFLVTHPGHAYSRDALLSRVWGFDYYGGSRTVDVHVRRVRGKLGSELAMHLRTVRGVGYMWE